MWTTIKGTICAVAATYSLSYECTGPDCNSLIAFPVQNWKCEYQSDILHCSNQKTCPRSTTYTDVAEISIDADYVHSYDTYTINDTSFSNYVSVDRQDDNDKAGNDSSSFRQLPSSQIDPFIIPKERLFSTQSSKHYPTYRTFPKRSSTHSTTPARYAGTVVSLR
jgi:hypothetical protein